MHHTDKYSQHSSIIWLVWLNGWVFVYELCGCGFESSCSHLNFRFRACFKQGVPQHLSSYRVYIHCETRTWHHRNIQVRKGWQNIKILDVRKCYSGPSTSMAKKNYQEQRKLRATTLTIHIQNALKNISSVKWSYLGHFFKSQSKIFLLFPYTLFSYLKTWKSISWHEKVTMVALFIITIIFYILFWTYF